MSFKEKFSNEAKDLRSFKKFYETIAFIVLAALILQQMFHLVWNLRNFVKNDWFTMNNVATANLQGFVGRTIGMDPTSTFWVIASIAAWVLYYVFMYFAVFNFASKRGMSKWTWTLFVLFGPNVIFAPAYIWFILFAYRYEIYAIFRKVVKEVGESGEDLEEDVEVVEEEPIEEAKPVLKPKPAAKPKSTETKTTTKKED